MRKFLSDALVVYEIQTLKARAWLAGYVLIIVLMPVATLYFATSLIPEGMEELTGTRLITGSLIFGIGLMTVNNLAQLLLSERFSLTLKLMITSPISRYAYMLGVIAFSLTQGLITATVLLTLAPVIAGVDIELDWMLVPVLIMTSVSLTGVGMVIATWAPSLELGGMLANLFGILVTLLSPVYFEIDRLPGWLQVVAHVSPYTYAASAVDAILSGQGDIGADVAILSVVTLAGIGIGTLGLRWRES